MQTKPWRAKMQTEKIGGRTPRTNKCRSNRRERTAYLVQKAREVHYNTINCLCKGKKEQNLQVGTGFFIVR